MISNRRFSPLYFVLLPLLTLFFHNYGRASERTSNQTRKTALELLHKRIDSLIMNPIFSPAFIGIKIYSLSADEVLYSFNSGKLFHPASNMKLLTTATAVANLESTYRFQTKVFRDGEIRNKILEGNIYIKASGDPKFTVSDLDTIAVALHKHGIQTIQGDIIGDVSAFDTLYWSSGWMLDDEQESYEAAITPLTLNDNFVKIHVSPGKKSGSPVQFTVEPPTRTIKVINRGITSDDSTIKPTITVKRPWRENTIYIDGWKPIKDSIEDFEISVWKPELWFLKVFKERLSKKGITVQGTIRIGVAKETVSITEISHPIDSILHQINKPSDNLAAEILLKTLSREKFGNPGSTAGGLHIVSQYLNSIGVDTTLLVMADGSGLSFYNEISPDAFSKILYDRYKDKKSFQRFYESLPVAGVDGTLDNRMKGTKAERNVHAKTGSISGVSSLTGYITTADGEFLSFSILSNHFPQKIRPLRILQDTIMELLANAQLTRASGK